MASASISSSSQIYTKTPHFSHFTSHTSNSLPFPSPPSRRVPPLSCSAAASSSSPFTEFDSAERHQRDSWLYTDNDIALQLPELKKLLQALKASRRGGGGGGPGSVCLVGTGPGDPELLTLKAARAIERADLILYDRLVSNEVLNLVRDDARLLYVGKTAGYHSRTQVFGRGGEEMDFLQQHGIEV